MIQPNARPRRPIPAAQAYPRSVDDPVALTHEELLVLAGLVRLTIEADDRVDPVEARAVRRLASELAEGREGAGDAYRRMAPVASIGEAAWSALWQEAVATLPTSEDVKRAALEIQRPQAREAIYGTVYDLAAVNTIEGAEWSILEWLEATWGLGSSS